MSDQDLLGTGEGLLPALGRYQLIRRLAMGGMAEIYLARAEGAEGFAKPVVIKRILPDQAQDPDSVALFVEEARLAARLNHANITQIFDFDEDEAGGYYMAMEYVHGHDLREVLDRCQQQDRGLGLGRAVWICAEVLEGLAYAHEFTRRGRPLEIVHRDISPRNILIGFNGDVKLADFGIARARGGLEEKNVVRGKIAYMSPEQICGRPLDRRSDLYSLGLVLYEMLTGVRPLAGPDGKPNPAITARAEFPPVEALRPDLPPMLCAILDRALRRECEERYADGREFLRALKELLFAEVRSPAEIEMPGFMRAVFPEIQDLSLTVSSARALLIQRETSGLQITDALRQALNRKGRQDRGEPGGEPSSPVPEPAGEGARPDEAPDERGPTEDLAAPPGPTQPERPRPVADAVLPAAADPGVADELLGTVVDGARGSSLSSEARAASDPPPTLVDAALLPTLLGTSRVGATTLPTPAPPPRPRPGAATPTVPELSSVAPAAPGGQLAGPRRAGRSLRLGLLAAGLLLAGLAGVWALARTGNPVAGPLQPGAPAAAAAGAPPGAAGQPEPGEAEAARGTKATSAAPAGPQPARSEPASASAAAAARGGPAAADGSDATAVAATPGSATAAPSAAAPAAASASLGADAASRSPGSATAARPRPGQGGKTRPGPAASAAPCILTVNADPYAEVWLDGKGPRDTPATWRQVPPGRHELRLVNRAAGVERREAIELAPGQKLSRFYEMRR